MATKTQTVGPKTTIESPAAKLPAKVDNDHVGTAIAVLEALEGADESIGKVSVGTDNGRGKVTIWNSHGHAGDAGAVPDAVHRLLGDWGYQHAGERNGDFNHHSEVRSHVYHK